MISASGAGSENRPYGWEAGGGGLEEEEEGGLEDEGKEGKGWRMRGKKEVRGGMRESRRRRGERGRRGCSRREKGKKDSNEGEGERGKRRGRRKRW